MRKVHQGYFAITLNNNHTSEAKLFKNKINNFFFYIQRNKSHIETNTLISDQSTSCSDTGNGMEQDPMQVLANQ
ncbi:unnamed protein product [Rotaria sp. Silwood2]|nr:unnamed protein product [Rotaria sp. Silwood2]